MDIVNKSNRPLVVPLPGGKKLHLGFRATGQIPNGAEDHPPVKKLLDAGDIVLAGASSHGPRGPAPSDEDGAPQVKAPNKYLPRSGER